MSCFSPENVYPYRQPVVPPAGFSGIPGLPGVYTAPAGTAIPTQLLQPGSVQIPPGTTTAPLIPGTITAAGQTIAGGISQAQEPPTLTNIGYIPAFLRTQIGKHVRVQFLIGTNSFLDKSGILIGVGISYILLREIGTGDIIMCDMYSIKFVTIVQEQGVQTTIPFNGADIV